MTMETSGLFVGGIGRVHEGLLTEQAMLNTIRYTEMGTAWTKYIHHSEIANFQVTSFAVYRETALG